MWNGVDHESMFVTTPPTGGSCGLADIEGEEYIVYAHDSHYDDSGYTVGICSRTALLGEAQAGLNELVERHAPQAVAGGVPPGQLRERLWVGCG